MKNQKNDIDAAVKQLQTSVKKYVKHRDGWSKARRRFFIIALSCMFVMSITLIYFLVFLFR